MSKITFEKSGIHNIQNTATKADKFKMKDAIFRVKNRIKNEKPSHTHLQSHNLYSFCRNNKNPTTGEFTSTALHIPLLTTEAKKKRKEKSK